jgi:hypothetical protein
MPHIPLPEGVPGPRGPMLFRPEIVSPMSEMAEILIRSSREKALKMAVNRLILMGFDMFFAYSNAPM